MSDASLTTPLVYPTFPELLPREVLREGRYEVRFARSAEELDAVLRLRFEVFNLELGEGLDASFETGRDLDEFDPVCHHLVVSLRPAGEVVGTYRLQTSVMTAAHAHGFYSRTMFDLGGLPPAVLGGAIELGRACVAREHRNTQVLFLLWKGLALYVTSTRLRYLFGCCSLTSQDPREGRTVMAFLEARGHVHPSIGVAPQPNVVCYGEGMEPDPDYLKVKLPKLFRIYLRHGAKVCSRPAIDRQFKTIDYLVLFDVDAMSERQVRTFFA
jgi:putative hemolysin